MFNFLLLDLRNLVDCATSPLLLLLEHSLPGFVDKLEVVYSVVRLQLHFAFLIKMQHFFVKQSKLRFLLTTFASRILLFKAVPYWVTRELVYQRFLTFLHILLSLLRLFDELDELLSQRCNWFLTTFQHCLTGGGDRCLWITAHEFITTLIEFAWLHEPRYFDSILVDAGLLLALDVRNFKLWLIFLHELVNAHSSEQLKRVLMASRSLLDNRQLLNIHH